MCNNLGVHAVYASRRCHVWDAIAPCFACRLSVDFVVCIIDD